MALADEIQKKLALGGTKAAMPLAGTQAGIADTVATRATGKAQGGGVPRASTVGEDTAIGAAQGATTQAQVQGAGLAERLASVQAALAQQVGLQRQAREAQGKTAEGALATNAGMAAGARAAAGEVQTAELGSKDRQAADRFASVYDRTVKDLASERGVSTADIFSGFKQGSSELALRKDAARIEQLAHTMAMADRTYVQKLQEVGAQRRLTDDLAYRKEAERLSLGDEMSALVKQLGWQDAYQAGERAFAEATGSMDLATALKISDSSIKQSNTQAVIQGGFTAGGAVISGVQSSDAADAKLADSQRRDKIQYDPEDYITLHPEDTAFADDYRRSTSPKTERVGTPNRRVNA